MGRPKQGTYGRWEGRGWIQDGWKGTANRANSHATGVSGSVITKGRAYRIEEGNCVRRSVSGEGVGGLSARGDRSGKSGGKT